MLERSFLLALLSIWMAMPAFAVNDWGFTGCQSGRQAGQGSRICFDFDSTFTAATANFSVTAPSAIACLKPDDTTEGAGTATAIIRFCPTGDVSAAANCGIQACAAGGCTLTGANGVPAAQLACVPLGPGVYRVDFPALPAGGELGLFTVEGGS